MKLKLGLTEPYNQIHTQQKFVFNVWSLLEMAAMSNEFGITGLSVAAASNEGIFTT